LTRRGKDTLAYHSDGRLAKVLHGAGLYTQYNYGFNAVIAKKYSRHNNQLKEETIYLVDAQMGRVYESKNKVYSYNNNGAIVVTKTFKYEYDANGYLKMKFNKDIPMERTMFNWTSVDNDLVSVVFYNQKGEQSALVAFSRYPKEDKLRLHSNRSQLDPYLKIFGKGPKKMTGNELVYEGPDNQLTVKELFNYLYNADGYPTGCQATNQLTNEHIAIIEYGYAVSRNRQITYRLTKKLLNQRQLFIFSNDHFRRKHQELTNTPQASLLHALNSICCTNVLKNVRTQVNDL
jgi:hypothetical protein